MNFVVSTVPDKLFISVMLFVKFLMVCCVSNDNTVVVFLKSSTCTVYCCLFVLKAFTLFKECEAKLEVKKSNNCL